jgi:hypothetical protein
MGGKDRKLAERVRTAMHEPLVHFLIAGLAIFMLSAWQGNAVDPAGRTIVITEEHVSRLSASWQQTWRRPPDPREIDALIRDYIKEEIYYREALRLGLDADDSVIRRRLRSKMEYLAAAQVESARPDSATLQAWLQKHPARFAQDACYSFDQIYLGADDADTASNVLKAVSTGADWSKQGLPVALPKSMENAAQSEVARQFGIDFAEALAKAPRGTWTGPVASGFGTHLVRIRQVELPAAAELRDVRQAVENDWRAATYKQREAKAYQALLDGYTIRIMTP